MQNKGIGISHLPNQRYRSFCKKGLNYNIMIIGSNGSGKSTFVNNLFRTELMPKNLDAYTLENQKNAIDVQKALVTFQVTRAPFVDKKFNIDIKIVEVDNVGDQINNIGCWIPISDYINDMYRDYYSKEKQMVKSMIKDERIHLCLYFVESYGEPLRQIDALILEKISKISNVVLVVGKSDILTNDEKAVFHDEIVQKLSENSISLFEPKDSDNLIYFIASKRQSVFNIDEGDLNDLHELIIRRGMTDLIEQTDTYYEAFRTGELTKDFGTSSPNEDEVQMSNEFIEMMNADEKRIDEARLEYVRRKNEYEERIGETNHTGSDY